MCIAYLIYNDGEPQGFGNKGKYLRNACQEIWNCEVRFYLEVNLLSCRSLYNIML